MAAPLLTGGQFLEQHGFLGVQATGSYPEYPELDAQLEATRKLDADAPEIAWIEFALTRARQARLAGDRNREQRELGIARTAIEQSFKRRTPVSDWAKVMLFLGIVAALGLMVWLERRRKLRRRRQALPRTEESYDVPEGEEEDYVDDDAEEEDDEE